MKHVFHPRTGYERNAVGDWRPAGTQLARRAPATRPRPTNGWTKPEAASFIHVRCPPMGRLLRGSVGRALRNLRVRIAHTVHHATTRSDASATCRASLRTGSGRFGSLQDPPRRRVVRRRVRVGQGTDTLSRIRGSRACRQRRDTWMNGSPRRRESGQGRTLRPLTARMPVECVDFHSSDVESNKWVQPRVEKTAPTRMDNGMDKPRDCFSQALKAQSSDGSHDWNALAEGSRGNRVRRNSSRGAPPPSPRPPLPQ